MRRNENTMISIDLVPNHAQTKSMGVFAQYARDSAIRHQSAFNDLVSRLSDRFPMPPDIAHKVAVYYVTKKIVKLDPYHGVYSVSHGKMLDPDVISRCAEIVAR